MLAALSRIAYILLMTEPTTYLVTHPFGSFLIRANLAEASAPIMVNWDHDRDEDSWSPTRHQTADARHRAMDAARLCIEDAGSDYYADPSADEDDDEQLDAIMDSVSIREV